MEEKIKSLEEKLKSVEVNKQEQIMELEYNKIPFNLEKKKEHSFKNEVVENEQEIKKSFKDMNYILEDYLIQTHNAILIINKSISERRNEIELRKNFNTVVFNFNKEGYNEKVDRRI